MSRRRIHLFGQFDTSDGAGDYPKCVIMTDDPLRAKMLAAHHLEYAALRHEQGDIMVYTGSYKETAIAVVSTGFGRDTAAEYLSEAKRLGVKEILYIGECVCASRHHALRTVILADGGSAVLRERGVRAAAKHSIAVTISHVSPCSPGQCGETEGSGPGNAPDLTVAADDFPERFYTFAKDNGIAALSVLTVSENTVTGEKMEEHERRSRLYSAARLVFETAALE